MPGPVALLSAGAFLPSMAELNRELLVAAGCSRPRVVILAAPLAGSSEVTALEVETGVAHVAGLGAEVEPVVIPEGAADADDAALQAIGEADVLYLVDGRRGRLCALLDGTRLGAEIMGANRRGAVVVGCSAGAEALASRHGHLRGRFLPWPVHWRAGLGLLHDAVIFPDYDRVPEPLVAVLALQAPRGAAVLGIDGQAALVGRDGAWQVHGPARVTVWRGRHRRRYRWGDVFRI